jgi:hemerythrin superfamily protein
MSKKNTGGRDVAMLMGGLAAGIVGSRLIPPLVAAMTGARRARAGGDPFALLIADHRKITGILDDMMAAPSDSKMRRSRLFLMLKRKLAKHAMAEEDVVYPIVHSQSSQGEKGKQLYDEHADMKILLYDIENKLMNGEDWSGEVRTLSQLVRTHIDEEENKIFPQLRTQLSETTQPKISGLISREEALVV